MLSCTRRLSKGSHGSGFRIAVIVVATILTISCSKRHPQNRYDWAMELAKTYTIQDVPKEFLDGLGSSRMKDGYNFSDLAMSHSLVGKFELSAGQLAKQNFLQSGNSHLLESIIRASKLSCDYNPPAYGENVQCYDRDGGPNASYMASGLRLLHTEVGDFVFSSADEDRGNGTESNENASPLVILVDPTDGGFGMILEDRISTIGGRRDVLEAALTLASSIERLEAMLNSVTQIISRDGIRLDLEAAKLKTLFKRPTYIGDEAASQRLAPQQMQQATDEARQEVTARRTRTPPSPQQSTKGAAGPLTKDQFKNLVLGKGMSEIRSILGPPSNTDESADGITWFYWSNHLPVRDPDSGTTVSSSAISFDPATKVAFGVRF